MNVIKNRKILLGIVTSLFWFSLYTYIPTFAPYLEEIGTSHGMIGIILGSYGFVQMILRIPLGILSDRLNRRKIFVVMGICFATISALGLSFTTNVYLILFMRALAGTAASTLVTYTILFSSYFKQEQTSKAIGIINSFTKSGQVAAMFLGGLIARYFGRQTPFLLAVAGGLTGIILSTGIEKEKKQKKQPLKIEQLIMVLKEYNLRISSILAVIVQLIIFATVFGFVPVAARYIGANEFQLGILTILFNIPIILAAALSGTYFKNKFGEKNTIIFGFIILALYTFLIPFINSLKTLYIVQITGGFGGGVIYPLLMGLSIKSVDQNQRATAMGFFQAVYGLGMFVGPVMVGFISDIAGLTTGFIVTGIIGIMGAVLSKLFIRKEAKFN